MIQKMHRRCGACRRFKRTSYQHACPACGTVFNRCESCGGFLGVFESLMSHVRYYAFDRRVKPGESGGRFHRDYWDVCRKRAGRLFRKRGDE